MLIALPLLPTVRIHGGRCHVNSREKSLMYGHRKEKPKRMKKRE
jgi:hypothetical protein